MTILTHDALKRQAEHLHAEGVLVAVGFHIGQIGVVEVALRLERPDAGVSHIERIRFWCGEKVAAEVHHWIGVALDAHGFI